MHARIAPALLLLLLAPLAAGAGVQVLGSLTQELEVQPGRTYEGSLEVQNPGDKPAEIRLYQTDYFFYADGKVLYGEPGQLPRSNAKWVTFSPQQATIPPKESVIVRYTVTVPSDETMKGTYWSMLMVEEIPEGSPESSNPSSNQVSLGVRQVFRYGVQISTNVGATGSRQLRFMQVLLAADKEKRSLIVDLENTGERWLRATLWTELYDAEGRLVGRFEGGTHRLYPGTTARFTADLVGVRDATYKALIVADCGGDDVFGADVSLVLRK
jgi:hypothetical protein